MKETVNEDADAIIAAYRCWGWDHWDEINHEDPAMRCEDRGPTFHAVVLIGTCGGGRSDLEDRMPEVDAAVSQFMGHAERISLRTIPSEYLRAAARDGACDIGDGGVAFGEAFEVVWEGPSLAGMPAFAAA